MTLLVHLYGPLRILRPSGDEVAPFSSRKVTGLFALLVTAPDLQRDRSELQALLWSDRNPLQQSASLRQALAELRRTLGPQEGIVLASRQHIGLDPDRIVFVPWGGDVAADFLKGLTIPDPAFNAWLRIERGQRRAQQMRNDAAGFEPPPPLRRPTLYFLRTTATEPVPALLSNLFSDALARTISEHFTVDIADISPRGMPRQRPNDLIFTAEAVIQPGIAAFRVALMAGPGRRLWTGHRMTEGAPGAELLENDLIQRLVNEAVEGYADALLTDRSGGQERLNASVFARTALRQIFTMRPELFAGADDLLSRANYLDPRGTYPAWRVLLRVIQLVELHPGDKKAIAAEAIALSRQAMEAEPLNSLVLAAASNVASLVENNPAGALELAQRAARCNPGNPFAWDCLSTAALHAGKVEEAYVFAVKAQRLAGDTPFKHWYDMGRALMATVLGRSDEALRLAGAASVTPHFKPPLRYIAALYADAGQPEAAQSAIAKLRALEPDFSVDRLTGDPEYPVAALRRSRILRAGLFGPLE